MAENDGKGWLGDLADGAGAIATEAGNLLVGTGKVITGQYSDGGVQATDAATALMERGRRPGALLVGTEAASSYAQNKSSGLFGVPDTSGGEVTTLKPAITGLVNGSTLGDVFRFATGTNVTNAIPGAIGGTRTVSPDEVSQAFQQLIARKHGINAGLTPEQHNTALTEVAAQFSEADQMRNPASGEGMGISKYVASLQVEGVSVAQLQDWGKQTFPNEKPSLEAMFEQYQAQRREANGGKKVALTDAQGVIAADPALLLQQSLQDGKSDWVKRNLGIDTGAKDSWIGSILGMINSAWQAIKSLVAPNTPVTDQARADAANSNKAPAPKAPATGPLPSPVTPGMPGAAVGQGR